MEKPTESNQRKLRLSLQLSYGLIACMILCLAIIAAYVGTRLLPGRDITYLPPFCFVISLLGIFSQRRMAHTSLDINPYLYRVVEWIVLLIVLKLTIYVWNGFDTIFLDVPRWRDNFLENFFNDEYLVCILAMFIAWWATHSLIEDLIQIEGDITKLSASNLDNLALDRLKVQERLFNRIMVIGIGLVILATLSRVELAAIFPSSPEITLNYLYVLVYFLLGFGLLSLTQLTLRRAFWAWDKITVDGGIVRNWIAYSLGILIALSFLAFILPTGNTLGILPTLQYLLGVLLVFLYALVLLIIYPIYLIFSWLMSLLRVQAPRSVEFSIPQQVIPRLPESVASAPSPFLTILKAIFFWGTFIFIICYACLIYIRQNRELFVQLYRMPIFSRIVQSFGWLLSKLGIIVKSLPNSIAMKLMRYRDQHNGEATKSSRRYIHLSRLDARKKILFYYLAMVRRSTDAGLKRQLWHTPNEYANTLKSGLPGVEAYIDSLTGDFMQARYTQHPITRNHVLQSQRAWSQIRNILAKRRKDRD